jgi:hypothetical protein
MENIVWERKEKKKVIEMMIYFTKDIKFYKFKVIMVIINKI